MQPTRHHPDVLDAAAAAAVSIVRRSVYDHPTPLDEDGTLPACLRSLERVDGLGQVVLIVAVTDESIEHAAEDRVREILADFPGIDSLVFGPAEMGSLHRRMEQLEFADIIQGVSLSGLRRACATSA